MNCPFLYCSEKLDTDSAKQYMIDVRKQIDEYIAFLENVCGKKLDHGRMKEVGRLSVEGQRLWQQVLNIAAHSPSPMTAFDAFP